MQSLTKNQKAYSKAPLKHHNVKMDNMHRETMASTVARMNNEGASLIEDQLYAEAIQILSQALPLTRQAVKSNKRCRQDFETSAQPTTSSSQHPKKSNDDEPEGLSTSFSGGLSLTGESSSKDEMMTSTTSRQDKNFDSLSSHESLFIDCVFSKPIMLEQVPAAFSPEDYSKLSAVLIFNLALAHHMYAVFHNQTGQNCTHLQRALGLYGAALKLSQRECNPLYMLAIQNNISRVHHSMLDEFNATVCAEALLSSIIVVAECSGGEHTQEALLTQFFGTVQTLLLQDPCTASAA